MRARGRTGPRPRLSWPLISRFTNLLTKMWTINDGTSTVRLGSILYNRRWMRAKSRASPPFEDCLRAEPHPEAACGAWRPLSPRLHTKTSWPLPCGAGIARLGTVRWTRNLRRRPARRYAELCFVAGRLGCFLNLQVLIMGDSFERVAYSSYGEADHTTESERLRDIGIDVQRFLRGLMYQFNASGIERPEIDPWRLARSIREAQLGQTMTTFLRDEAKRRNLDPTNRLRAAQTLAFFRLQSESSRSFNPTAAEKKKREAVVMAIRSELETMNLPEPGVQWARKFGND